MSLKTLQFRDIDDHTDNLYEAVAAMSGQARNELQEQILSRTISDHKNDELDVFDEIEEPDPNNYVEKEKVTSIAVEKFLKERCYGKK